MTGAPDEETARNPESDDGSATAASPSPEDEGPDEEETSDLELIEGTPAPVSLPLRASEAPPSPPPTPAAPPKRPPPLPTSRSSQTRPVSATPESPRTAPPPLPHTTVAPGSDRAVCFAAFAIAGRQDIIAVRNLRLRAARASENASGLGPSA